MWRSSATSARKPYKARAHTAPNPMARPSCALLVMGNCSTTCLCRARDVVRFSFNKHLPMSSSFVCEYVTCLSAFCCMVSSCFTLVWALFCT